MTKTKSKKIVFEGVGCVLDKETGEIIEPASEDYRIIIEDILPIEESSAIRF